MEKACGLSDVLIQMFAIVYDGCACDVFTCQMCVCAHVYISLFIFQLPERRVDENCTTQPDVAVDANIEGGVDNQAADDTGIRDTSL